MDFEFIMKQASEELTKQIRAEVMIVVAGETDDGLIADRLAAMVEAKLNNFLDSSEFGKAVEEIAGDSNDREIEMAIERAFEDYPNARDILSKDDLDVDNLLTKDDIDPSDLVTADTIEELENRIDALEKTISGLNALISNPAVKVLLKAFGVPEESLAAIAEHAA